ncbi:hypothetical protein WMW71_07000 [Flavobacterium buctense]|uniref:Uncharacterized protein n=1 Tax=Flavobacterium buctense TaxID=1648146 RepID=A0ABU9E0B1_9FLAO|nr:hypothetical protein [Flavobacterium buctense]
MKNYILLFTALSLFGVNAQEKEEKKLTIDPKTNCELRYFYFPNMEAYYDLKNEIFHFQENNTWVTNKHLPNNYGGYSLYKRERVTLTDFEGDNPEQLIKIHRKMYPYNAKGRVQRPDQPLLLGVSAVFLE